jgi:hypothetical protein
MPPFLAFAWVWAAASMTPPTETSSALNAPAWATEAFIGWGAPSPAEWHPPSIAAVAIVPRRLTLDVRCRWQVRFREATDTRWRGHADAQGDWMCLGSVRIGWEPTRAR